MEAAGEESRQGFVQVVVSLAPDQMMRLSNTNFLLLYWFSLGTFLNLKGKSILSPFIK